MSGGRASGLVGRRVGGWMGGRVGGWARCERDAGDVWKTVYRRLAYKVLANGTLFKHLTITPLKLQVWWTTWLGLSEILLLRNGWAVGHLQFYVCRSGGRVGGEGTGGCVRELSAGRAGGLENLRNILIYNKSLLVKLQVCAKYVIIISGQMAFGVKMLSHIITMSTTSKYNGLQNPFSRTQIDGHLTRTDVRPDGRMDERTTDG